MPNFNPAEIRQTLPNLNLEMIDRIWRSLPNLNPVEVRRPLPILNPVEIRWPLPKLNLEMIDRIRPPRQIWIYTILVGLLLAIRNGFSTIPLCVLTTKAESIPELGIKYKVQDTLGCQKRCVKINCPNVGFLWSRLCENFTWRTNLLLNPSYTTVSAKTEGSSLQSCPKPSILWI